jgi:hypothetical protein
MFKAIEAQKRHKVKYHIVLGTEANASDGNLRTPSMLDDQINDIFVKDNELDESRQFGSDFIEIDYNPCGIGECQFLNISHKLRKNLGFHMSGLYLRRLAIEHISRQRQVYEPFLDIHVQTYIRKMARKETRGDNLTLVNES